ncbi:hypothetical protein EDB81DRAFT_88225 [Dactylonectria macrodidyma]|uniref:Gpi-anchored protein n=1 Tax=Dactylonectria macrodidyma TaxID=307937 RepID=A0A9P9EFR0_9HYPO|nr:hypothetical protein EDB81DRAFT_88225 [Dactylonectria macrodidyma]
MIRQSWLPLALLAGQLPSTMAVIATATSTVSYAPAASFLFRRADSCPSNTFQCSEDLGAEFSDICCQDGQACALDANNDPACCPSGAVCTGTAPASATGDPTAMASYVSNSYFSFPIAPTSYDDSDACNSAIDACSDNYDACITVLGDSGSYGVTIAVPGGGGTTVAADGSGLGTSATAICSSLSSRACSDLEATKCSEFGSAAPFPVRANLFAAGFSIAIGLLNLIV